MHLDNFLGLLLALGSLISSVTLGHQFELLPSLLLGLVQFTVSLILAL